MFASFAGEQTHEDSKHWGRTGILSVFPIQFGGTGEIKPHCLLSWFYIHDRLAVTNDSFSRNTMISAHCYPHP